MKQLIFTLILMMTSTLASAENAVKRESVEHLLEVMKVEATIDAMYSQLDQMFLGMAKQLGIRESEQHIFDNFMSRMATAMEEEMTWEKMKDPMIDIYIKHYSETEINDLLKFYSTDSGKAIISKMPLVMHDSMLVSQSMIKDFMPRIKELSIELNKELKQARNEKQTLE